MTATHWLHLAGGPPGRRLRAGSLCTGYGGLDLAAAAVLGARLAWCAESDRHAAAVLAARYPGVPNLGDITALDWAAVPPVDLITAGWPCQDISYSGPGTGIKEGTRSGLWLTIAAGLRHLRPRYVSLHEDISDIQGCIAFRGRCRRSADGKRDAVAGRREQLGRPCCARRRAVARPAGTGAVT